MNYIVYKKNLRLGPSLIAFEVARLSQQEGLTNDDELIVIGVSTKRFEEIASDYNGVLRTNPDTGIVTCCLVRTEEGVRVKL